MKKGVEDNSLNLKMTWQQRLHEVLHDISVPAGPPYPTPEFIHKVLLYEFLKQQKKEHLYEHCKVYLLSLLKESEEIQETTSGIVTLGAMLKGLQIEDPEVAGIFEQFIKKYPKLYERSAIILNHENGKEITQRIYEILLEAQSKTN